MNVTSFPIIIYNSSARLPETLCRIAALDTKGLNVEVIVVDNTSTDKTPDTARREWARHPSSIDFQVVHQRIPDLGSAIACNPLISQGGVLIRRSTLAAVGGLREWIWGADDRDIYLHLCQLGQVELYDRP